MPLITATRTTIESLEPRRLLSDGSLDTSFGTGGIEPIANLPSQLLAAPSGQTYAAGSITIGGATGIFVRRYNEDGSLDATFGKGDGYKGASGYTFIPISGTVNGIKFTSTDDLIVGINSLSGQGDFVHIFRTGDIDSTFGIKSIDAVENNGLTTSQITAFAVDSSGHIDVVTDLGVLQIDADGSFNSAFDNNAIGQAQTVLKSSVEAIALEPNGVIVLGYFSNTCSGGGDSGIGIAYFNDDGSLDTALSPTGTVESDYGVPYMPTETGSLVLAVQGNGEIIAVSGTSATESARPKGYWQDVNVTKFPTPFLNADYSLPGTQLGFGDYGRLAFDNGGYGISNVMIQPQGQIIIAGSYLPPGSTLANSGESYLLRLLPNAAPDANFGSAGYVVTGSTPIQTSLQTPFTLSSAGTIEFPASVHGQPSLVSYIAFVPLQFTTGTTVSDIPMYILPAPSGQFYTAGTTTINGIDGIYVRRYNENGSPDSTFADTSGLGYFFRPTDSDLVDIKLDRSGDIVLNANPNANRKSSFFVRLLLSGQYDSSFGLNGIVTLQGFQTGPFDIDGQDRVVAPTYGTTAPYIRLNSNGTLDSQFGASLINQDPGYYNGSQLYDIYPDNVVTASSGGGILLGDVTFESSVATITRFNANGSPDNSFGIDGSASTLNGGDFYETDAANITILSNGNILLTAFEGRSGPHVTVNYEALLIAEFLPNGSPDLAFGTDGYTITSADPGATTLQEAFSYSVNNVMVQPDGKIIIAGSYSAPGSYTSDGIQTDLGECYILRLDSNGQIDTTFGNDGNVLIGPYQILASGFTPFALIASGQVEFVALVNDQPEFIGYSAFVPVSPTVTGTIYNDTLGQGAFTSTQSGLANQTVYADLNDNGKLDPGEPMAVTNSHGNYTLSNLPTGPLIIRQVLQTGQRQSAPSAGGGDHVVTAWNSPVTANFETTSKAYLSGTIFNDKNANGKLDSGETGLAGCTVYVDLNHDGKLDGGDISTLTSSTGGYAFYQLSAGTYTIRIAPPVGWKSTTSNSASLAIKLQVGQVATNYNFGFTPIVAKPLLALDEDLLI